MKNQNKTSLGLSLIEVTISIVVLAMICGGLINILGQGFVIEGKTKKELIAMYLATNDMEVFSNVSALPASNYTEEYGNISNFTDFKRVVNISDFDFPQFGSNLRLVNVTVFWRNDSKNISFSTLKAHY